MTEDKLDMILDYLTNMTNRQHAILRLLHKIEEGLDIKFLQDQIDKLAKYILEYFPGSIVSEGACLTAIAIMEELRNK